jgi:hypothetical protein
VNEEDKIAYFTYVAQTSCDLVAIPIDVVVRRFRSYSVEVTRDAEKKSARICTQLDMCMLSGEYEERGERNTGGEKLA